MEPGGTLHIAASYQVEKSARKQPYVQILFEDTGCGMPPEILEHIFEPFYITKEKGIGTGLGLFICYVLWDYREARRDAGRSECTQ